MPIVEAVPAKGARPYRASKVPCRSSREGLGLDTPQTGPNTLRTRRSRDSRDGSICSALMSSSFPSGSGFRCVRFRGSTRTLTRTSMPQPWSGRVLGWVLATSPVLGSSESRYREDAESPQIYLKDRRRRPALAAARLRLEKLVALPHAGVVEAAVRAVPPSDSTKKWLKLLNDNAAYPHPTSAYA